MNPVLEGKDKMAVEGMRIALEAVDAIIQTLLDQIRREAEEIDRQRDTFGFDVAKGVADLVRLAVQRGLLEGLREGIPAAILEGDPSKLARLI